MVLPSSPPIAMGGLRTGGRPLESSGFLHIMSFSTRNATLAPFPGTAAMTVALGFDANQAIDRMLRFLDIPGVTGEEEAIGRAVAQALRDSGVPTKSITFDTANKHIPLPTQTG